MANGELSDEMRTRDGRTWEIGNSRAVDWIAGHTAAGLTITSGIPAVFDAYATVVLPDTYDELQRHERALLALLADYSPSRPWWLGYLDTGAADIVFPDAPMVTLYAGWRYVLVAAGPEQAATWRERGWKGALPDLLFPADRSWLVSTLWDDEWTCVGGPEELVASLEHDPELKSRARRVTADEDATPPGHHAF